MCTTNMKWTKEQRDKERETGWDGKKVPCATIHMNQMNDAAQRHTMRLSAKSVSFSLYYTPLKVNWIKSDNNV